MPASVLDPIGLRPARDGDGDGTVGDGTPRERPARLPVTAPPPPSAGGGRDFGDAAAIRAAIHGDVLAAARAFRPLQNTRHTLALEGVAYDGPEDRTLAEQKAAVLEGRTLARRLVGTWVLRDNDSGDAVSRRTMTLAQVPYFTPRGTFIKNGTEYSIANQLRLKPGVYAREKENGDLESHINIRPGTGASHRIFMEPATGRFRLGLGQAQMPLVPLLRAMGATPARLRQAWGGDLAHANLLHDDPSVVDKLHARLVRGEAAADPAGRLEAVKAAFEAMPLDPDVTRRTLGHPHDHVTLDALLDATKKLIAIHHGEAEVDDRDDLAFMTLHGPEDLLAERTGRDRLSLGRHFWKASRRGDLGALPTGVFTRGIEAALTSSGLAQPIEAINPLQIYEQQGRVSRMGEGGIPSLQSVPESSRNVQPSHYGFIDPLVTPESLRVGVDSRVAAMARKGPGGAITSDAFRDARTGRTLRLTPAEAAARVIAFPGELASGKPEVDAMQGGKVRVVPRAAVDAELGAMQHAYSPATNLVPMFSAVKPQRAAMAQRMLTQALPLVDAEAPHVRSGLPDGPGSFEHQLGEQLGAVRAHTAGTVVAVDGDRVQLRGADGKLVTHPLYRHFPFNRKTAIHQTAVVRPGQPVSPGDLLARSNYTDARGVSALGKNARVAYIPYEGSVAAWTHVLWYRDGQPRFTPVSEVVAAPGLAALATEPSALTTGVTAATGFSAHAAGDLLDIRTSSGRRLAATPVHSFVELGDDGHLCEVAGSALRPGASWLPRLGSVQLPVTVAEVAMVSARRPIPLVVSLDEDFGFVCGLYVAEGSPQRTKASFAATDPVLRRELVAKLAKIVPDVKPYTNDPNYILVAEARLAAWLRENCGKRAQNKRVPDVMFGASEACRRGFVAGFWVGDGRVHDKHGVPTDTDTIITSRRLRDGLGLLMASIGISTTHGEYDDPKYTDGKAYRLGVAMRDAHKMPALVHSTKGERLARVASSYCDTGAGDHVPLFEGVRDAYRACGRGKDRKTYGRVAAQVRAGTASRRDILTLVPSNTSQPALARLRQLAASSLEWDRVVSVAPLPHAGWVYDFDMAPVRTFVCVDTLVVHNSNYEDAIVVSESFARRMTSDHLYQHTLERDPAVRIGRDAHTAIFPGKHDRTILGAFDADGVIRPGTRVEHGHPLILAAKERERSHSSLHRGHGPSFVDHSVEWEHHAPGVVTDVARTPRGVLVAVQSHDPLQIGDKLSCRYGDKGVLGRIIPDHAMPHDEHGTPFEVLMNPLGTISRTNPAQHVEGALGKIAAKTGVPYVVRDFDKARTPDLTAFAEAELAKHGFRSDSTERVYDPAKHRWIVDPFTGGDPQTGNRFVMKLHHSAESKAGGRGMDAYTSEGSPAKGGVTGSKRMSLMDLNALLSHGATSVVRDAGVVRGQAQPEAWAQFMAGHGFPEPQVPHVHAKFVHQLRAAGIDPVAKGTRIRLMALSGGDVDALAGGRDLKSAETVDWKGGLRPVAGGLFDPALTGGHHGNQWSAIKLHESFPSPVMEDPIRHLLGLTEAGFRGVLAGRESLRGRTGPGAIAAALDAIDVPHALERARGDVAGGRKGARDAAVRRLGYLKAAAALGVHPRDWVWGRVPVLPPVFRPVSVMQGSRLPMVADANLLYRELFEADANLAAMHGKVDDTGDERLAVYDAMKGVVGLGDPVQPKNRERQVRGLLKHVFGHSSKTGVVQRKLLGTATDLVGRAVITPDPTLDLDEVGIPESKAWDIYRPFVMRRLRRNGVPAVRALREVDLRTDLAREALHAAMGERPVIVTRAPVLHRYGNMSMFAKPVAGETVRMHPFVTKGYNADFDGDAVTYHVPASDDAVRDAVEKMLPSRNLFAVSDFKAHQLPSQELLAGLYTASAARHDHKRPRTFATSADAIKAYRRGELTVADPVEVIQHE